MGDSSLAGGFEYRASELGSRLGWSLADLEDSISALVVLGPGIEVFVSFPVFWTGLKLTLTVLGGEVAFWVSLIFLKLTVTDRGRNGLGLVDSTGIDLGPGGVGFTVEAGFGVSSSELLPSS